MNDNAKKWVAALRSGEFQQTKFSLHRIEGDEKAPAGYCCLGVACEVFARENPIDRSTARDRETFDGADGSLPHRVMEWLSIRSPFGDYARESLSMANDRGWSFAEIADMIESEPAGLFTDSAVSA